MIDDLPIIIRQLQIDLITGQPNTITTWFNDLWTNLSVVEINVNHCNGGEFIYYNDDVVFYYDAAFKTIRFSFKYNRDLIDLLNLQYLSNANIISDILLSNIMDIEVRSNPFSARGLGKTRNVLYQYLGL